MRVHCKYGMIQIVKKLYSFLINNLYYIAVINNGRLNQKNNETYELKFTNSKVMMTKTILINCMNIHCIINMYNSKQLY